MALYRGLKRVLSRPNADRIVVVIASRCSAFSLNTGLSADDYIHKLIATGARALPAFARDPLDMYRFTGGEQTRALMREGVLSWWEDPEAKLAFFRPLSALTHYIDYTLWPEQAWAMHLHSMLWSLLLFWGVLVLYRALIAPAVGVRAGAVLLRARRRARLVRVVDRRAQRGDRDGDLDLGAVLPPPRARRRQARG